MKQQKIEEIMTRLGFTFSGNGEYQLELAGECSTLKVDISFNYKFIEGNQIVIDDIYTINLNNIDTFNKLLQEDIVRYKKAYASLKEALERGE
jgi:hypothetical protein